MKKEKNEIKIGAILSYVIIALNMIIGIAYTPLLTHTLGQNEYGLYSLVSTVISYLTVLDFGFGNAIIIYTSKYRASGKIEEEQRLHGMFFIIYLIIGLIAGIIGIFIALNVKAIFGKNMTVYELDKAKILMFILSINLFFTFAFSIFNSIITAYEKFVFQKIVNIIRIFLQPIIMFLFLKAGFRSVALVLVISGLNIMTLLLNFYYCKRKLNIKLILGSFNKILFFEIICYSVWVFLNTVMDKINWSLDQSILGIISGTAAVSIYTIGGQLDQMYMHFSTAISGVLLPRIAKMEASNASDKEFSEIFIKAGRIQYIILALIMTGFMLFGKEFIELFWLGKEYSTSYYIALILMLSTTFPLIQNIGLNILQAKKMYKYRVKVLLIFSVLNIIISIVMSQYWGAVGAALGTAITQILGQGIFMNVFYYKKVGLDIFGFWKQIIKMSIPIIIIFLITNEIKRFIKIESIIILLSYIIIYTLSYLLVNYLFILNKYEKNIILKPLGQIISRKKIN